MQVCLSGFCWIPSAKEPKLGMGLSGEKDAEMFVCIQPVRWSTLGRGVQTTVSDVHLASQHMRHTCFVYARYV